MNKYLLYHGAFAAVCAGAILPATVQTVHAADLSSASASHLPINLARGGIGARLEMRQPKEKSSEATTAEENISAQALISDDAALTFPLKAGQTSFIVALNKVQVLNEFNFVNYSAGGKVTVSVSTSKLAFDDNAWKSVGHADTFDSAEVVTADLGSVEAHYVKIDFETSRPGRISGFGLFGAPVIGAYQSKPFGFSNVSEPSGIAGALLPNDTRNVYFDLANLNSGAKVVSLSRGGDLEGAQTIIDGNVGSNYAFDSTDPAPAVVVDLGVSRSVDRLSCVYSAPAGRLDFYLVDNPYRKGDQGISMNYVDSPTLQPVNNVSGEYNGRGDSKGRQAVYSVDTSSQPGLNRLATDLTGQHGRFLVAEFHPTGSAAPAGDFKDRDFKDKPDFKDFKDQPAGNTAQPLRILSLSAFGHNPNNNNVPQIPPVEPNTPGNPGPQPPVLPPGSGNQVITH